MLRKRTRSVQKEKSHMDHQTLTGANSACYSQPDTLGHNTKGNSSFNASAILIGLNPKGLSDSDYSVWSPTSPLDFRVLSNLGNIIRTPTSLSNDGHLKSWNSSKVGLGIVDSLEDFSKFSGKVLRPSKSKNIIFSSGVRIKTPNCHSTPGSFGPTKSSSKKMQNSPRLKNENPFHMGDSNILFEIGETHLQSESFGKVRSPSLDSNKPEPVMPGLVPAYTDLDREDLGSKDLTTHVRSPPHFIGGNPNSNNLPSAKLNYVSVGSATGFTGSLLASEIELSEDYGDCNLECNSNHIITNARQTEEKKIGWLRSTSSSETYALFATADFLSSCYHCNKKLEDGKDIYMYRGETAFCSSSCRAMEIMLDEQLESEPPSSESSKYPDHNKGNLFATGVTVATTPMIDETLT